ncbi:MAG: glycine cleavage system aminomethyltransferase GcvT [archaeon]
MPKKTVLFEQHLKLGAKMIDFGGWSMPVSYTTVIDEHVATRTKAGLFDICHMGEVIVEGPDAARFLQRLVTNDVERLTDGRAQYACICREDGTTVDDLFVYRFSKNRYMLVTNAANAEKDLIWAKGQSGGFDVEVNDIGEKTGKIDLQGPNSEQILSQLTDTDLSCLKRFFFTEGKINGVRMTISRTGYTAEDGFELYPDAAKSESVWIALLRAGSAFGLKPVGLGARDTLRIEACYSLYGHELSESITPIEAGLGLIVKPQTGFIGSAALSRQMDPARKIVAFEMTDSGVPRADYRIICGEDIGYVTSGTFSPTFRKGLGQGLISAHNAIIGKEIGILIRERKYRARIVERPFYAYGGRK